MRRCAPTVWVVLLGCGGQAQPADGGPLDAGAGADASGAGVDAPTSPTHPALVPCPVGWTVATAEGSTVPMCEPWPLGEPGCPAGTARFPGDSDCLPLGPACPPGAFAADVPAGALFVEAGAGPGGDGSRATPFDTIAAALAAATSGTTIALSAGTFEEAVVLPQGVTLQGACVDGTRLSPPTSTPAIVSTVSAGAAVRDLTLAVGFTAARADLEGVLQLTDVRVSAPGRFGLVAWDGGRIEADGVVIEDVVPDAGGDLGIGVVVGSGGTARIVRGSIERSTTAGVMLADPASHVDLQDVSIRDARPTGEGHLGQGIAASGTASLRAERVVIDDSTAAAVFATGRANLELHDVLLRGVRLSPDGMGGVGLSLIAGATVSVRRAAVLDADLALVSVFGFDSALDAHDLLLVQPGAGLRTLTEPGWGLAVGGAARAAVRRLGVFGTHGAAVVVAETDTRFEGSDVTVSDTRPLEIADIGGRAFSCEAGASCTLERFLAEDSGGLAVAASGAGTALMATDLAVRRVRSRPWDGLAGRGVNAQDGASVDLRIASIDQCREVAVLAAGDGTRVALTEAQVRGTLPRGCEETTCPGQGGGTGVAAITNGWVELRSFLVTENTVAGLQLARNGRMTAHDGEVSFNAVGLNVQGDSVDLATLGDDVRFRGNGVNLDSTALPIPEADPTL